MRLHVLASGSKGNCSVVQNSATGALVVIDCGISKKAFMEGCSACGLDPARVEAILVTHEHADHVKGLGVLTRGLAKLGVHPALYASAAVHGASPEICAIQDAVDLRHFCAGDDLRVGGMHVHAFATSHDAAESFGFRFDADDGGDGDARASGRDDDRSYDHDGGRSGGCASGRDDDCARASGRDGGDDRDRYNGHDHGDGGGCSSGCDCDRSYDHDGGHGGDCGCVHGRDSIGFMTDTGIVPGEALEALRGCRVLAIEANHDVKMLANGPYPAYLKARVGGERGHLSNDQSAELLETLLCNELQQVIGMHVSQNNNTYSLPPQALGSILARNDHPAQALVGYQARILSAG